MNPSFRNLFMKELTLERVVPTRKRFHNTHKIVLNTIRCPYCVESLEIGEVLDHLPQCKVRAAALKEEATLGRILTADEIAALR